jgi:hypothetical protein
MSLLHVTVRFGNVMREQAFLKGNPELFPGTSAERLMNGAGMKNPDYFRMNFLIERKG